MSASKDRYLRSKNQLITPPPLQDWVGTWLFFNRKLRFNPRDVALSSHSGVWLALQPLNSWMIGSMGLQMLQWYVFKSLCTREKSFVCMLRSGTPGTCFAFWSVWTSTPLSIGPIVWRVVLCQGCVVYVSVCGVCVLFFGCLFCLFLSHKGTSRDKTGVQESFLFEILSEMNWFLHRMGLASVSRLFQILWFLPFFCYTDCLEQWFHWYLKCGSTFCLQA